MTIMMDEAEHKRLTEENERLSKCCMQRGARMQIMRDWIIDNMPFKAWEDFEQYHQAFDWFDDDGVPK